MKKVYLVAVVVALIAGICTFLFATQLFKTVSAKSADTTTVLVPQKDIDKDVLIGASDIQTLFREEKVFNKDLIENVVLDDEFLVDKVTNSVLYAGEQINQNRLIDQKADSVTLSLKLPDGYVAYAIKAEDTQGVDGYISEGDTVDLGVICATEEAIKNLLNPEEDENGQDTDAKDKKKDKDKEEKDLFDEVAEVFQVKKFPALKVLKVSNHMSTAASEENGETVTEYKNITLMVTEEQADELQQIETFYGTDGYKLRLRPRPKTETTNKDANK